MTDNSILEGELTGCSDLLWVVVKIGVRYWRRTERMTRSVSTGQKLKAKSSGLAGDRGARGVSSWAFGRIDGEKCKS